MQNKKKIRIIKKNDEYSADYQTGDIFSVDSTWYGGVNVTSRLGIPLSLAREEYEEYEEPKRHEIDRYSYELGVMDCFCEMVAAGLKTLAMSHPCETKEVRDSYFEEMKKICEKYDVKYYPENEAFLTDLFPAEMNRDKYNYLFFRTDDVLEQYLQLKKRQKELLEHGLYTKMERYELAKAFGRLLSYPEEGIERLIAKAAQIKNMH